jgi:coniferyl-aldehyde dehydrogenase
MNQPSTPESDAATLERMRALFARQRDAYARDPLPAAGARRDDLRRVKRALLAHEVALAEAVSADFGGRAREETVLAELIPSAMGIDFAVRRLGRWMRPQRRRADLLLQPLGVRVVHQPLGVAGIIVPWNYPIYLALEPLTAALAAGNRAMLKLSEFTPRVNAVLQRLLAEALPEDKVAVVTGDAGVGAAFSALPFDHLLFTGNGQVARKVMQAAAGNLTPVTLELGGKSPLVLGPDVALGRVIDRIVFGKALNAGQTCVAPDHVYCPEARRDEFVVAYRQAFAAMFPRLRDNPQYTSIASDRQHARLQQMLADARAKGARVEVCNPAGEDFAGTRKMPLHLVLDPTEDMLCMRQEIFGPILPVLGYRSVDDAIRRIAAGPRPLALYVFSDDRALQRRFVEQTHSGAVGLNEVVLHAGVHDLPFGGVGESGMGQYHGQDGFRTFSKAKGVVRKGGLNSAKLVYPPYGSWLHRLIYRIGLR